MCRPACAGRTRAHANMQAHLHSGQRDGAEELSHQLSLLSSAEMRQQQGQQLLLLLAQVLAQGGVDFLHLAAQQANRGELLPPLGLLQGPAQQLLQLLKQVLLQGEQAGGQAGRQGGSNGRRATGSLGGQAGRQRGALHNSAPCSCCCLRLLCCWLPPHMSAFCTAKRLHNNEQAGSTLQFDAAPTSSSCSTE